MIIVLLALAITAPVSGAATHTLNPGDSIQQNITDAGSGDTLILNPGTYYQTAITVDKDITIRANTSYTGTAVNTIIDATNSNMIFIVNTGRTVVLDNLTLMKGSATSGGAIDNSGTLTIISSTFSDCSASSQGGAIYNRGTLTIISSTFTNCSASGRGGAIYSFGGTLNITSSIFSGCSAPNGGAIYNSGPLVVSSSSFSNCQATNYGGGIFISSGSSTITASSFTGCGATNGGGGIAVTSSNSFTVTSSAFEGCSSDGNGGAIIAVGSTSIHFSRFYGNTGLGPTGFAVWQNGGTMDAANNWWGTNDGPGDAVRGDPVASWLVLGITATPDLVSHPGVSTVRTNLTFTNGSIDTSGGGIYVMDKIVSNFAVDAGTGSVAPGASWTANGVAQTTFTSAAPSLTSISGKVDGQYVYATITVFGTPTVTSISPATGRITGGEMVTITGTGLSGATAVKFDASPAFSYHVDSDTQITAVAPNHAKGPVHVVVTTPGGSSTTSAADLFTYTNVPVVTGVSPANGPPEGTMVTITGRGFTSAATDVKFGTVSPAWFSVDNDMQITAWYQPGAPGSTVDITVITPEGTSATGPADKFTYDALPPTPDPNSGDNEQPGGAVTPATTGTQQPVLPEGSIGVNAGGNSAVGHVFVTGTGLSDLIVTGTTQPGPGTGILPPQGTVYQYIDLVPARYTSITGTTITFTVPGSWLPEHHLAPQDIVLYHYVNGAWVALPTTIVSTSNGVVTFTATSPSFSLYAIAGQQKPDAAATATPQVQTFGSLVAQSAPALASVTPVPVVEQTTAAPAKAGQPQAGFPVMTIILVAAGIILLAAGGFMARRWWIRRQNPALFREYD